MLTPRRRALVTVLVAAAALAVGAAAASAHATVSPPVAKAGATQVFTLAVPTEREDATTATVELTPPTGFAIDSFAPAARWKRTVEQTGSGEQAVVRRVVWAGGRTPADEAALFQFVGHPAATASYRFNVRQTYSNGEVVEWSGEASSDTPAPVVQARDSFGGGGGNTLLTVVALILGVLGLLVGIVALLSGSGNRPLA